MNSVLVLLLPGADAATVYSPSWSGPEYSWLTGTLNVPFRPTVA